MVAVDREGVPDTSSMGKIGGGCPPDMEMCGARVTLRAFSPSDPMAIRVAACEACARAPGYVSYSLSLLASVIAHILAHVLHRVVVVVGCKHRKTRRVWSMQLDFEDRSGRAFVAQLSGESAVSPSIPFQADQSPNVLHSRRNSLASSRTMWPPPSKRPTFSRPWCETETANAGGFDTTPGTKIALAAGSSTTPLGGSTSACLASAARREKVACLLRSIHCIRYLALMFVLNMFCTPQ